MNSLTLQAPAKINLFLEVLHRRDDGFHELLTVMQAVSLYDDLEFVDRPEPGVELDCDIDLGPTEQNLAWRAAELLHRTHASHRGAQLSLRKRIPHGAGLGGGSSDAATALVGLNLLWGLGLDADRLRTLAGEIGSDCAFFVSAGTALCTGRGEKIEQKPDLEGLDVVILYPDEVIHTSDVYHKLSHDLTYSPRDCYLFHGWSGSAEWPKFASQVTNRLQEAALSISRKLRDVWQQTGDEEGVVGRIVSGSGSSIAFLMQDERAAADLKESFDSRESGQSFAVKTLGKRAVGARDA